MNIFVDIFKINECDCASFGFLDPREAIDFALKEWSSTPFDHLQNTRITVYSENDDVYDYIYQLDYSCDSCSQEQSELNLCSRCESIFCDSCYDINTQLCINCNPDF